MPPSIGLQTLDSLASYLNSLVAQNAILITRAEVGEEGRTVSIENEGQVKEALLEHFDNEGGEIDGFRISKPASARFWYDFALTREDGVLVPVNIKSTTSSSADNCGSKEGIYYSLTGLVPSSSHCRDYDAYFEYLREGLTSALDDPERQLRDYFFLVCLKLPGTQPKFFVQTLRSIETFTPNGNNPPFQCAWARNERRVDRTFEQGALKVLTSYQTSMQLRAAQYSKFQSALDPLMRVLAARAGI